MMINKEEKQTFGKNERLCRKKLIEEVFETGNVFYTSLFRVIWITAGSDLPYQAQVAISVPKKIFRLAVTRNLIRRRIREAYRKSKHQLYSCLRAENTRIAFILIYRDNSTANFKTTEESVREVIEKLCDRIKQNGKKC